MNLEFMILGGLVEATAIWNLYVWYSARKLRNTWYMRLLKESE